MGRFQEVYRLGRAIILTEGLDAGGEDSRALRDMALLGAMRDIEAGGDVPLRDIRKKALSDTGSLAEPKPAGGFSLEEFKDAIRDGLARFQALRGGRA